MLELEKLPKGLEESYAVIYAQIKDSGVLSRTVAKRTIRWLLCEMLPLSSSHFLEAVWPEDTFHTKDPSSNDITAACCNLVILDKELDVFRFAHLSVREFLEEKPEFTAEVSNAFAAERCLDLCIRDLKSSPSSSSFSEGLIQYALLNWGPHCELAGGQRVLGSLKSYCSRFLGSSSQAEEIFSAWVTRCRPMVEVSGLPRLTKKYVQQCFSSPSNSVFAAIVFGMSETLEERINLHDKDLTVMNDLSETILDLASMFDRSDIISMLLSNKANLHFFRGKLESALYAAAASQVGDTDSATELLIDHGANPYLPHGKFCNALQAASYRGNVGAVIVLSRIKDLVRETGGKYGNALQSAAASACECSGTVVHLLLESGAEVNISGGRYGTPLLAALWKNNIEVAEILLESGADPSLRDKDDYTPLSVAASTGDLEAVILLVEHGADIYANARGCQPLGQAAKNGHPDVVNFLLKCGTTANTSFGNEGSPLRLAIAKGHSHVVKQLLKCSPQLSAGWKNDGTLLENAAYRGHVKVARVLCDLGAAVSAPDKDGYTAMYSAICAGHIKVFNLLLKRGADFLTPTNGWLPLHLASWHGHLQIVRRLIEKGARVRAQDKDGCTALHRAARRGHLRILNLLLTSVGPEMTEAIEDQTNGWTCLHQAVLGGHLAVINRILELQPGLEKMTSTGVTPLLLAVNCQQTKIVHRLLEGGANPDTRMSSIWGASLHMAVACDLSDSIDTLLEYGADPFQLNGIGESSVDWAIKKRHRFEKTHLWSYIDRKLPDDARRKDMRESLYRSTEGSPLEALFTVGHYLMFIGELNNALADADAKQESLGLECSSCSSKDEAEWFVCTSCFNKGLCNTCKGKHATVPLIPSCRDHTFLEISRDCLQAIVVDRNASTIVESQAEWVQGLIEQFFPA